MKVTTIKYSLEETIPTVQFANVKPAVAIEAVIEAGDNPDEVKARLRSACVKALEEWKNFELRQYMPKNLNHGGTYPAVRNNPVQVTMPNNVPASVSPPVPVQREEPIFDGKPLGETFESDTNTSDKIPPVDAVTW